MNPFTTASIMLARPSLDLVTSITTLGATDRFDRYSILILPLNNTGKARSVRQLRVMDDPSSSSPPDRLFTQPVPVHFDVDGPHVCGIRESVEN